MNVLDAILYNRSLAVQNEKVMRLNEQLRKSMILLKLKIEQDLNK